MYKKFWYKVAAVNAYFRDNDYNTDMIYSNDINKKELNKMSKKYDTYILTTYNDKSDLNAAVHTVSITVENGKYVIHNAGSSKKYNSLSEAINGYNNGNGEPISVIGIKKKGGK